MSNNRIRDEKLYAAKCDAFFEQLRQEEPFSETAVELLRDAVKIRQEYEENVAPVVSFITKANLEGFQDMMPKDIAEELFVQKSRGIGILRAGTEEDAVYSAGLVVFYIDREALDNTAVLRIKWLYVHPSCRRKGIGDSLIVEIMALMLKEHIQAVTIDLPANSEETVLYKFLERWDFSFVDGIEPTFIMRLSDIPNKEDILEMSRDVMALSSIGGEKAHSLLHAFLDKQGYQGFLKEVYHGYINYDLSCYIKSGNVLGALALVHKTGEGRLVVEYIYADSGKTDLIVNLISFISIKAMESMGGATILEMNPLSYEEVSVLDSMFPRQRTVHLTEGILARE